MKKNLLVKKYGKEKRWVNYKIIERKGKKTKIPYSIKGKLASSTDANTWATYDEARKASDQVGITFAPDQKLLGIDIDHCLTGKKITHEQKETIAKLILEADTYTEISPSGEGLHLFLEIRDSLNLVSNKCAPYEAYTSGRYFTFTGNTYGEEREVRSVSSAEALKILGIIGYPWKKEEVAAAPDQKAPKVGAQATTHPSMDDSTILEKMFASKGGDKIKALYGGDISNHKKDASSADMALLSHLAFWTRKDPVQMERMWLVSPLGQREKTTTRKDYRDRSIGNAITACKNVYETKKEKFEKENPDLDLLYTLNEKGGIRYLMNLENVCRILRKFPLFAGRFRHDVFRNVLEMRNGEKWKVLEDSDSLDIQSLISIHFTEEFSMVTKGLVYDAMIKVCKENTIDSASDWINSLKWDGTPRLDTWLTKTYGTPDDIYYRSVGSNWMKGLVNRIINPGVKFDYVLVLEGPQGAKKSTSLHVLGGDWHVETAMSTESKDFFMQFAGKAIIEFSEGETLNRTEVKRMKAIITMQSDKYRPPYERSSQEFPRRCVFAMTTNQTEYLKDETGNRRWLPVAVVLPQADIEWLKTNRDQLFAEARHRVIDLKETTYDFPIKETLEQQQSRRISDPNEDKIMHWYMTEVAQYEKDEGITIDRVYKEALHSNMPGRSMNKAEQMSIANVLKDHLKLTKRQVLLEGVRAIRWFNETGEKMSVTEEQEQAAFHSKDF